MVRGESDVSTARKKHNMDTDRNDQLKRNLIELNMRYIAEEMNAKDVLCYLPGFSKSVRYEICQLHKTSRADANKRLVEELMASGQPGWFTALTDALREAEFKPLCNRLLMKDVKNTECYSILFEVYQPILSDVDPSSIMPYLLQKKVITTTDLERISNLQSNESKRDAMMELLLVLPMHSEHWFQEFVIALHREKYQQVLEAIDPKFACPDSSEESLIFDIDKFVVQQSQFPSQREGNDLGKVDDDGGGGGGEISARFSYSSDPHCSSRDVLAAATSTEKGGSINDFSSGIPSHNFNKSDDSINQKGFEKLQGVATCFTSSPGHVVGEETPVKGQPVSNQSLGQTDYLSFNIDLRADAELTTFASRSDNLSTGVDRTATLSSILTSGTDVVPKSVRVSGLPRNVMEKDLLDHFGMVCETPLRSNAVKIERNNTGDCLGRAIVRYESELEAQSAVEVLNGHEWKGAHLTVEIHRRKAKMESAKLSVEDIAPAADMSELSDLKLRSYQLELAEKAMEGKNCLIIAPTGSGKTHVALAIVKHHFEKYKKKSVDVREPKAVFFVPTVQLVEQQKRQFTCFLGSLKTLGLSGSQGNKVPLNIVIPQNDVLFMTPQIMENALRLEGVELLHCFSLLIFDECHHTDKNHPYNAIMSHYIDKVLEDEERRFSKPLPQVVGLTASVGVGKAKSMEQAVDHILKLCANMDCRELCTVTENVAELKKHANRPDEETKELQGRTNDPFQQTISAIMSKIENGMRSSPKAAALIRDQPNLLQGPNDRGSDRYTQWISGLDRPITRIYDQSARRFFVSCQRHLVVYNTALLINADCRTQDALAYIDKEFEQPYDSSLRDDFLDETDKWLQKLYQDEKDRLTVISRDPRNENPKLRYLRELIIQCYDNNPDSRGIIFVKTREMTVALVSWINETDSLKSLNPHNLVGSNAPSQKAGQTQFKQEDVLKCFKEGKHKVIVATSVAEEGLDVQQCNWVIRYEHVTNSIARVQSRGRARADKAKYCLVAEQGRGVADKEMYNKIRETMMQQAIEIIQHDRNPNEIRQKIRKFQKEAKVERSMLAVAKIVSEQDRASRQPSHGEWVFRCRKCDAFAAFSTDLRTVENSHRVVLDKEFKMRSHIVPHPKPKKFEKFELTGKVLCKKCGLEWGVMGVHKKISFPILKLQQFICFYGDQYRERFKCWKDVPFTISQLGTDDLSAMSNAATTPTTQDVNESAAMTDDLSDDDYSSVDDDDFDNWE